jgi:prepilin-type N-terminal cleavage/methylation domain-containing protein
MMTRRQLRSLTLPARPAFTLVELLVVVSIIAILVALTATAVFGVRRGMQKTNAEATCAKVDQKILQRMKQMDGQITHDLQKGGQDNPEVVTILGACGGNKDVAKAVMMYARMRRDFPMTYREAKTDFMVCTYRYRASPAFAALPAPTPVGSETIEESAACLYAAIAPMGLDGLEGQVSTTSTGQKCFTDGMNMPIGFVRMGYDGNNDELTKPTRLYDPFYPNKNATTGAYRNLSADFPGGVPAFTTQVWSVIHPNVVWFPAPRPAGTWATYPGLKNHTAFCFSAGVNGEWDIPDPPIVSPAQPNSLYDGDNLFSYRLRKEGASGD